MLWMGLDLTVYMEARKIISDYNFAVTLMKLLNTRVQQAIENAA